MYLNKFWLWGSCQQLHENY